MSTPNPHAGHFGWRVIGKEAAAEEARQVRESEITHGPAVTGKGGRSLGPSPEAIARHKAAQPIRDTKIPPKVEAPDRVPADPVATLDPGVVIAVVAQLTGKDPVEVRAVLEGQGAIPPGAEIASAYVLGTNAQDPNEPLEPAKGDVPPPPPDANGNGLPDSQETKGDEDAPSGYLRVAEFPTVLQAQPELFDRLLELELAREDGGRKTAYRELLEFERHRESPREPVLEALRAKLA